MLPARTHLHFSGDKVLDTREGMCRGAILRVREFVAFTSIKDIVSKLLADNAFHVFQHLIFFTLLVYYSASLKVKFYGIEWKDTWTGMRGVVKP